MKPTLAIASMAAMAMIGCEDFNRPISSSGFDPLGSPGSMRNEPPTELNEGFLPGQFVSAMMPNTAFFSKKPQGNAEAERLLPRGESMKVISVEGSFLKAELDSGEVGYVPTIMVEDPNAAPITGYGDNPYDVFPMEGDFETLPDVPPGGNPPSGALPTVVNPSAPAGTQANPSLDTIPSLPPETPAASGTGSTESGDPAAAE